MRESFLELLRCPNCTARFRLIAEATDRGHVMSGCLVCIDCERNVPIDRGVPDFVVGASNDTSRVEQTTAGFARNWRRYSDVILASPGLNDALFREWVWPLRAEKFEGKVVLDSGCGMGRWMTVAVPHRPEVLVGFDYANVIWTAFEHTAHIRNVHTVRADIFSLPFAKCFDVCYSIGVVHHTPDPEGAFRALVDVTRDDGVVSAWVYGKENNAWIEQFVTPVRERLTSRLPDNMLHALSRALTLQLLTAARAYVAAAPTSTPFSYDTYLRHLLKYPPRYVEHIVYDHLVPSLAHYHSREELQAWADRCKLNAVISARNRNSWRVVGSRSKDALHHYSEPSP